MNYKVLVFGLVFVTAGLILFLQNNKLTKVCTAQTEGTVTGHYTTTNLSQKSKKIYHPIYTYSVSNVVYTHRSPAGSSKQKLKEGNKITVYFEPSNPTTCYIKEEIASARFIGTGIAILGVITVIFSFFWQNAAKEGKLIA